METKKEDEFEVFHLSKKAIKKIWKAQRYQLEKAELKKKAKMNKKLKKKAALEEKKEESKDCISIPKPKMISTEEYIKITSGAMKVVIDCAFEKLMTDKEISSIGTQLCYCYHSNKSSKCPVNLIFSGVGPLVKDRLKLLQGDKWPVPTHEKEFYDLFDNKNIVYLTGDSPNTLEKFDESCIYIIGGLVDRNRHKSCTYNKALDHKINTAKLPIREHISLTSSAILTVVHVMEIMLKFREKPDWKEVLCSVIPKRKVKAEDE